MSHSLVAAIPSVLVVRSAGAWVYFNAEQIRRRFLELVSQAGPSVKLVVVDCSMVPAIDITALSSLRAFALALKRQGIALRLAELRDDVAESLRHLKAETDLGTIAAHETIDQCIDGHVD